MTISTNIVLASQSIGRKMLLEKLGVPFDIIPSTIDEDKITDSNLFVMIQKRSDAKARDVAQRVTLLQKKLIIAADSAAILNNQIFGKPRDRNHAFQMIKKLQGKTHTLATAMTIICCTPQRFAQQSSEVEKPLTSISTTKVTIRPMTDIQIRNYTNHYDLRRFAASYAINETPWNLITKIDGSFTNVIGLPFEELLPILKKYKIL